jgi:hypothetical protein
MLITECRFRVCIYAVQVLTPAVALQGRLDTMLHEKSSGTYKF